MILLKNRDRNPSFKKGEYIEINDAGNYPMELSIDGVCKQETTTGKNLLKSNLLPITKNGITISENDNGDIVLNGTITGIESGFVTFYIGNVFNVEAGTYTSSLANKRDGIGLNTSGFEGYLNITMSGTIKTKTATATETQTINPQINIRYNAGTFNNFILNPMLEKSSSATKYEPYTGGQPSPSPDYPQPISVIENSLKITSCNKNVFKITSPLKHYTASGVDISINDNVITLNGTATGAMWPDFIWGINGNTLPHNKCKYYFSEQLEDYTATINVLSGTATNGSFVIVANDDSSSTFSFDFKKLQGSITRKANGVNRAYLSGIYKGTKFDNFTFEIMLEKGSVATAFERHIESQIQANLPEGEFIGKLDDTYKDTLNVVYKDDGHYHLILKKMINRITITSDNVNSFEMLINKNQAVPALTMPKSKLGLPRTWSTYIALVNRYKEITSNSDVKSGTFATNFQISYFWLFDDRFTDLEIAKSLVIGTEIYNILATPYEIDLGIVDTLLSYDEITNIFTDSDLLPTINVKYYKDFEFDKILRSGYNIDEQEYEIAKKQMANGKRKRILSSYDDCIIKINLGLLDNKTYQEYKKQLDDGEFHYWSYKYNQYKKANFILTKPSITTEYAYDDDIGINDMEITLEKSSDIE